MAARQLLLTLAVLLAGSVAPSGAACDLRLTKATVGDSSGAYPPRVGDAYSLRVEYTVRGTPAAPFRIHFEIANGAGDFRNLTAVNGGSYVYIWVWWLVTDGELPWRVELDPDHVAGDTDLPNNVATGTFEPAYPARGIESYDPLTYDVTQTFNVDFGPGSIGWIRAWMPKPVTASHQEVLSAPDPVGCRTVVTAPYGQPVFEWYRPNLTPGRYELASQFRIRSSNQRVNPHLLRQVKWSDYARSDPNVGPYLADESAMRPFHDELQAFVDRALPPAERAKLAPYDVARQIFLKVVQRLPHHPAQRQCKTFLDRGGDCGYFAAAYIAALRAAGLPIRMVPGCWTSDKESAWHVWTEIWFPGHGWMMADPSEGAACDPTGTYPYRFGQIPNGNTRCALTRGADHRYESMQIDFLQPVFWFYSGSAPCRSSSCETRCRKVQP